MKKIILALALTSFALLAPEPPVAKAQVSWACEWRTYCNAWGCYTRQYCCAAAVDYWGNIAWRCEWR